MRSFKIHRCLNLIRSRFTTSKNKLGQDSPFPKFLHLKIRRRNGVESLTTLEEGEFKFAIDGCIRFACIGILHLILKYTPCGKFFEKYITGWVWIFKYTFLICDCQIRFITEGVNPLFRSAKWAYLLGIHTSPVLDVFFF